VTTEVKVSSQVVESTELAAERGWKVTLHMQNGDVHKKVFITAHDWDFPAVVVEKVGERHKDPTLVLLKDVQKVEVHW
jgi:carotenoid cleavage dioxygenase-like enzyme